VKNRGGFGSPLRRRGGDTAEETSDAVKRETGSTRSRTRKEVEGFINPTPQAASGKWPQAPPVAHISKAPELQHGTSVPPGSRGDAPLSHRFDTLIPSLPISSSPSLPISRRDCVPKPGVAREPSYPGERPSAFTYLARGCGRGHPRIPLRPLHLHRSAHRGAAALDCRQPAAAFPMQPAARVRSKGEARTNSNLPPEEPCHPRASRPAGYPSQSPPRSFSTGTAIASPQALEQQ
jgi:hypothetical protein